MNDVSTILGKLCFGRYHSLCRNIIGRFGSDWENTMVCLTFGIREGLKINVRSLTIVCIYTRGLSFAVCCMQFATASSLLQ